MQEPTASSTAAEPRKMTDAEFFGVPDRKVSVAPGDETDRPEWYQAYLSNGRLKEDFRVWHDAGPALDIFLFCQTQWRHGYNGVTGLDYTAVMAVIAPRYPYPPEQVEIMDDIHLFERGAMTAFNELRKIAEDKAEAERERAKQR